MTRQSKQRLSLAHPAQHYPSTVESIALPLYFIIVYSRVCVCVVAGNVAFILRVI